MEGSGEAPAGGRFQQAVSYFALFLNTMIFHGFTRSPGLVLCCEWPRLTTAGHRKVKRVCSPTLELMLVCSQCWFVASLQTERLSKRQKIAALVLTKAGSGEPQQQG